MAWIKEGFWLFSFARRLGMHRLPSRPRMGRWRWERFPHFGQLHCYTTMLQCYTTVTVLHHSVTVLHHPPGYRRHLCSILYCVKQCNWQCVIWWFPHFGQLHQCYTTSLLHCTVTPQASPPPPVLHEPPPPSLQQVTCLQNVVQVPSGKDL